MVTVRANGFADGFVQLTLILLGNATEVAGLFAGALDRAAHGGSAMDGRVGTGLLLDAVLPGHEGLIATLSFEFVHLLNL